MKEKIGVFEKVYSIQIGIAMLFALSVFLYSILKKKKRNDDLK